MKLMEFICISQEGGKLKPITIDMCKIDYVIESSGLNLLDEGKAYVHLTSGIYVYIDMAYQTFVNTWRNSIK